MITRYRNRKKAVEVARLLATLDTMACETRSWRPRRAQRVSLGPRR